MDREDLLFCNVNAKNHSLENCYIDNKIRIKENGFNIKCVYKIIEHIKWINENIENGSTKILIDSKFIVDQVIILILESVIYHALKVLNISIRYRFNLNQDTLGYKFYMNSLLYKYNNHNIEKERYIKDYEKECTIYGNHYRKRNIKSEDKIKLSITMDEISTFLKNLSLEEEYSDSLSEVIIEIIGNAVEHSGSSCMANINVLRNIKNKEKIIDIAIVDYSDIYFGTGIEEYLKSDDKYLYNEKNRIVLDAYNKHKEYFSSNYKLSDFSMVSAFQKNVSSRKGTPCTGGTGLTTLIKALIDKSIANYCYACSGETILFFDKKFLELTPDGLIGFNKKNDYINSIPNLEVVSRNLYNINVNAYNLQFIFKEIG